MYAVERMLSHGEWKLRFFQIMGRDLDMFKASTTVIIGNVSACLFHVFVFFFFFYQAVSNYAALAGLERLR